MRAKLAIAMTLASISAASCQSYTQMQWGLNKGATPNAFGAKIDGTWRDLGTISASGVYSINAQRSYMENTITGSHSPYDATAQIIKYDDAALGTGYSYPFLVSHFIGGSGATGRRPGGTFQLFITQATGNTPTSDLDIYTALSSRAVSNVPDNGVPGTPQGRLFGANPVCEMKTGATNWKSCEGMEVDVITEAGTSVDSRYGILISDTDGSRVQGNLIDAGLAIGSAVSSPGFQDGILFDWTIGGATPVTGNLIRASTGPITTPLIAGIDFTNLQGTFSRAPIVLPANNKGIWWGAAAGGGQVISTTTANGGVLNFGNDYTVLRGGGAEVKIDVNGFGFNYAQTATPGSPCTITGKIQVTIQNVIHHIPTCD